MGTYIEHKNKVVFKYNLGIQLSELRQIANTYNVGLIQLNDTTGEHKYILHRSELITFKNLIDRTEYFDALNNRTFKSPEQNEKWFIDEYNKWFKIMIEVLYSYSLKWFKNNKTKKEIIFIDNM